MTVFRISRWILTAGLLALAPAWGNPRTFPADSVQVMLTAAQDPYLTVDGEQVTMNAAAIIFGTTNTTMVRGQLSAPAWIRIEFDQNCMVRRVWVLNDDEVTAVPMWTSLFGSGFVPPTCNNGVPSIAPGSGSGTVATTTTTTTTTSSGRPLPGSSNSTTSSSSGNTRSSSDR